MNKAKSRVNKIKFGNDAQFLAPSESSDQLLKTPAKYRVPTRQMLTNEGRTNHYEFGMRPPLFNEIIQEQVQYENQLLQIQTQRPGNMKLAKEL